MDHLQDHSQVGHRHQSNDNLTTTTLTGSTLGHTEGNTTNTMLHIARKWHKTLGKLWSMALALPGARGLFSLLQEAFCHTDNTKTCIHLTPVIHHIFRDIQTLYDDIMHRPTCLYKIVPQPPSLIGSHDASRLGTGGIWLPSNHAITQTTAAMVATRANTAPPPLVWRTPFPTALTEHLISPSNPWGSLTNSDLKLAGSILHHDAAAHNYDIQERTIFSKTDNTPTLYWQHKGSATTTAPPAHLLWLQAFHQWYHRYLPLHDYITGTHNTMSDNTSWLTHLNDTEFLTHLNSTYPQLQSWQLWTSTPEMHSAMIWHCAGRCLCRSHSYPRLCRQIPMESVVTVLHHTWH